MKLLKQTRIIDGSRRLEYSCTWIIRAKSCNLYLEMIYEKINTLVTKELLGRLSGLDEEEPS